MPAGAASRTPAKRRGFALRLKLAFGLPPVRQDAIEIMSEALMDRCGAGLGGGGLGSGLGLVDFRREPGTRCVCGGGQGSAGRLCAVCDCLQGMSASRGGRCCRSARPPRAHSRSRLPLAPRGGRAGEAARFMAALRRAAARERRDTFDRGELQASGAAHAQRRPGRGGSAGGGMAEGCPRPCPFPGQTHRVRAAGAWVRAATEGEGLPLLH